MEQDCKNINTIIVNKCVMKEGGTMEKQDQRDVEIEQLNKKIERYRQALSSLKAGSATADIHLKKRLGKVEKSVEQLNEQLDEMAKLLEEGLSFLSTSVKELGEKYNDVSTRQIISTERGNERVTENSHDDQSRNVLTKSNTKETPSTLNPSIPSFKQLQHMAIQQPVDNSPKPLNYNRNQPPLHSTSIKAVMSEKNNQLVNEENKLSEEPQQQPVASNERIAEVVTRTITPIEELPSSSLPSARIVGEVKVNRDERTSNSPLWNVFKRK